MSTATRYDRAVAAKEVQKAMLEYFLQYPAAQELRIVDALHLAEVAGSLALNFFKLDAESSSN